VFAHEGERASIVGRIVDMPGDTERVRFV
jgi:hypothetical protein